MVPHLWWKISDDFPKQCVIQAKAPEWLHKQEACEDNAHSKNNTFLHSFLITSIPMAPYWIWGGLYVTISPPNQGQAEGYLSLPKIHDREVLWVQQFHSWMGYQKKKKSNKEVIISSFLRFPQFHLVRRSSDLSEDLVTTPSEGGEWGMNQWHKESWVSEASGPWWCSGSPMQGMHL